MASSPLNIQILEAGTQVGIKVGNKLEYYDRDKVEVYSTDEALVGLTDLTDGSDIVLANTTDYLIPKEASVKDLIEAIHLILSVVYVDYLTIDEIDAIQNSNNPSAINVFVTNDDLDGFVRYKGDWDANTNTPALASGVGTIGDTYRVSVAGSTNLDGITDWVIGDRAYFDGTVWQKDDNTDQVSSVFSRTGAVVAVASDYDASQIDNDSGVTGAFVDDALDTLDADLDVLKNSFYIEKITPGAPVTTTGVLVEFFSSATGGVVPRSISPAAGTYRVKISMIVANSSANGRCIVDLTVGGTSIFSVPYNKQPKTGAGRHWVTIERRVALGAGAQNVDINITNAGPGSAAIYEANVEIEEILT